MGEKRKPEDWVNTLMSPYCKGTSDDIRRILNHHKIGVFFSKKKTILNLKSLSGKDSVSKDGDLYSVYVVDVAALMLYT